MTQSNDFDKSSAEGFADRRPITLSWDKSVPDMALRKTGISLMADVPWGTHVCLWRAGISAPSRFEKAIGISGKFLDASRRSKKSDC